MSEAAPFSNFTSDALAAAAELTAMREQLAQLEQRLGKVEAQAAPTMDTATAMQRLGYKTGKGFWQAVRRLGIPYSRISARHCMFRTSDIDATLLRRQVGNSRLRRLAA
jgi:3-hydroxyacyl-CoA dehydrogenase